MKIYVATVEALWNKERWGEGRMNLVYKKIGGFPSPLAPPSFYMVMYFFAGFS
jgi:hypothetical protein